MKVNYLSLCENYLKAYKEANGRTHPNASGMKYQRGFFFLGSSRYRRKDIAEMTMRLSARTKRPPTFIDLIDETGKKVLTINKHSIQS